MLLHLRNLNVSLNNNLPVEDIPTPPLHASVKQLSELTLLPNSGLLRNELDFEIKVGAFTSELTSLKVFNDGIFEQKMTINVGELSSLQHHIVADDANTKDSATCSCVEGNPCISKYNCHPHIWHRRFEVARLAREDPDFDREKFLSGEC